MKLQTNRQKIARETSLISLSFVYRRMATQIEEIAKNPKRSLELIWFLRDKNGKIIKTGNSNKMAFRRNQLWRNFTDERHNDCTVHLIDMLSGIQSSKPYTYAIRVSSETLRKKMIAEILGMSI